MPSRPSVGHTRRLFRREHQIHISTLLSPLTSPGFIANIFVTPFLCFTTADLVHLMVLTSQGVHNGAVPPVYVDAILAFTRQMYHVFIARDVPIRSAPVVTRHFWHVDLVI